MRKQAGKCVLSARHVTDDNDFECIAEMVKTGMKALTPLNKIPLSSAEFDDTIHEESLPCGGLDHGSN